MTLDEAIEAVELIRWYPLTPIGLHTLDALKLSIEAMKAWKDKRLFSNRLAYYLLPGETEK